jgi:tRNA threonylcarbamoyl adenosine modification protein YeaZ
MLVLGINTATAKTAIALIKTGDKKKSAGKSAAGFKTIFFRAWESKRNEAEKLLPQIRASLKKGEPDKMFVVTGPGAFTALRIGVTAANTLAYAVNAPIISCSTFEFLTHSVPKNLQKSTAIFLKAGGEFVAVRLPSSKAVKRMEKNHLERFFASNRAVKFAVSDMSAAERKKCVLPKQIKWLPDGKIIKFDEVVADFAGQKIRAKKQVAPQYLLPPKITVSKKEVFV